VHFGAWPERNPQNQANFEGGRIKGCITDASKSGAVGAF